MAGLPRHADALRRLGVTEIIEVGSGGATTSPVVGFSQRFVGRLDPADLGAMLERTAYGLIEYPPRYLGKSGVFAAYCAHGCAVLNVADAAEDSDGLQAGVHFASLSAKAALPADDQAREAMAAAALKWYEAHGLERQAAALAASCAAQPLPMSGRE